MRPGHSPSVARMPVLTAESVLADLRRYPLLTPEQLARAEASARKSAPGPDKIIRRLVERGWLTPYQADHLQSGRAADLVFGNYVLLAKIGEGGMGAVFKARHVRLDRTDAVKVIRADRIASNVVARRFLREIRLTSSLEHPHIVRAVDAGRVGRQFYLATEYIPGEDLGNVVRRNGPLAIADACLVVYQTSLALQYIHGKGLVHRDIKPSNLVREESTRAAKLLDLGLSGFNAKADPGSIAGTLTRDGVMLGTPDFMAPEQVRDPHGVDIRADLYSLGCTFFFLLTGRPPFLGSAVEKMTQHLESEPPPLDLPQGAAPPALAAIVSRLLAKQPEERFQTPQALIDSLLALRPGQTETPEEVVADTGKAASRADEWQSEFGQLVSQDKLTAAVAAAKRPVRTRWPWWRRRRTQAAAAVLMVAVGGLAVVLSRSNRNPQATAASDPPQEPVSVVEEPADELRSLRRAVVNPAENRDQLRRRVIDFRGRQPGTPLAVSAAGLLRRLPSPVDQLKTAVEPETDAPVARVGEPGNSVDWLGFTPTDDRLLVLRTGMAPEVWSLPAAAARQEAFGGVPIAVSAATDGQVVVGIGSKGELSVASEDGRIRAVKLGPSLLVRVVGVAPTGKTAVVAFLNRAEQLARVDLETGRIVARLEQRSDGVDRVEVAPDGGSCLVSGSTFGFRVFSFAAAKPLQTLPRAKEATTALTGAFGPDGQRVYLIGAHRAAARFATGKPTPEAVYEVGEERVRPGSPKASRTQPGRATCIAVSADESAVAVGTRAGNLYVYAAASGKPTQELHFSDTVQAIAFSTHGRVLAVALNDGSVLLVPIKG